MQDAISKFKRKVSKAGYLYRNGGLGGLVFSILYATLNRFTRLHILRMVKIDFDEVHPAHLDCLDGYRYGFFRAEQMRPYADDPENDLSHEFLDYASAKGDRCFAIFDHGVLANYCWSSEDATHIEDELYVQPHPSYYYRYKEFTRVSHRGRRLSSCNSAESLRALANAGKRGFFGYVEADNFISYRSLKRKNHTFVGTIVVLGAGPRPWIWHSSGAQNWGFRVGVAPHSLAHGHGRSG